MLTLRLFLLLLIISTDQQLISAHLSSAWKGDSTGLSGVLLQSAKAQVANRPSGSSFESKYQEEEGEGKQQPQERF